MQRVFLIILSLGLFAPLTAQTVEVDASQPLGPLTYGATGFLYGLGDVGIPSAAALGGLRPQIAAQKAFGGLQHPNGDAQIVAPDFRKAVGREIQIYLQDIYQQWPYEKLGISDYLSKVDKQVKQVLRSPDRDLFTYVPFNEPDVIWYQDDEKSFWRDWKAVYRRIKSLDPQAKICGPNYTAFDYQTMKSFLIWAQDNQCLPDIITWHELQNDFFSQWDNHLSGYRDLEQSLKLSVRPIVINEYGRFSGDLGVPGHLMQYIARFERDGVAGCLAYWTTAGALNDLVTANNQPTGAWWLYHWYGELTGQRVETTPPRRNFEDIQGLAAFDAQRAELRVLVGGGDEEPQVLIRNLDRALVGQSQVRVQAWRTDSTGKRPAGPPVLVLDENRPLSASPLRVALGSASPESAWLVVVSAGDQGRVLTPGGPAVRYTLCVPRDGYYNLKLAYRSEGAVTLSQSLTEGPLAGWALAANPQGVDTARRTVFLPAGLSLVDLGLSEGTSARLDGLTAVPAEGSPIQVPLPAKLSARGPWPLGPLPPGTEGPVWLVIHYANGELGPGATNYNSNIVDRAGDLKVGSSTRVTIPFRNTLGWKKFGTVATPLNLPAGAPMILDRHGRGDLPVVDTITLWEALPSPLPDAAPTASSEGTPIDPLEAEAPGNRREGTAALRDLEPEGEGTVVGYIGYGTENRLVYPEVILPSDGTYRLKITYVSGEDRRLEITVDDEAPVKLRCPSTGSWSKTGVVFITLSLKAGPHRLAFGAPRGYAPDLDRIDWELVP